MFRTELPGIIHPNKDGWTVELLDWADPQNQGRKRQLQPSKPWRFLQGSGTVQGRLIGGCVEVLEVLRGTPVWPEPEQWDGAILFWELSEEGHPPDLIVRALRSYAAMGVLQRLGGILFARPGGGVPVEKFAEYDAALRRTVAEEYGLTEMPIVSRMDFGHTDPMCVLPYGVMAEIDCDKQHVAIVESAVTD